MLFVNLNELLKIVQWLFKNYKRGHLTDKVVARANKT